jgi:serine/threonine-protein kinase
VAELTVLSPGEVFAGRFEVEQLLKAGGMGAVYRVRHLKTDALLALKLMHPQIVSDDDARARFAQEARIGARIESSHVVNVLDADVDASTGVPWLVMELLKGRDFAEIVRARGHVPPSEVVAWLVQVGRALDKAHARGVVHRDLKPENLFLTEDDDGRPRVKILDFGIAKIVHGVGDATTQSGGTPGYMAPEQARQGGSIGPATDVWALGLITYTLLVGRNYWESSALIDLVSELVRGAVEPASVRAAKHGVTLPATFDAWFARCVHASPRASPRRARRRTRSRLRSSAQFHRSLPPTRRPPKRRRCSRRSRRSRRRRR